MRESARVLKPGGRLDAVVIEVATGLEGADLGRALELGPGRVAAPGTLEELVEGAGLATTVVWDLSGELHVMLEGTIRALEKREGELRDHEGDEIYDEERAKKGRLLEGVERGLLRRTLVMAERRGATGARRQAK